MIAIMMWVWVVLFIASFSLTCWAAWKIRSTGNRSESYDIYGKAILFVGSAVFNVLAWFTIKALQSVC